MRRSLAVALATTILGGLAAAPAGASRIYAGQPTAGVPAEIVLALTNSGTSVSKLTFHLQTSCGADFDSWDYGSTLTVDAAPDALEGGSHYLVGGKVSGGRVSGTILGADRVGDTTWELMRIVLAGTVSKTKASGTMAVSLTRADATTGAVGAQCAKTIHWAALRNPGVVFGGATSDGEPLVLELKPDRKHVSHAHVAWSGECKAGGAWINPHDEFDLRPFALSRTGAFSRTYRFSFGQGSGVVQRFAGRVSGTRAAGTFQSDVTLAGTDGTDTCSTGKLAWTATSG